MMNPGLTAESEGRVSGAPEGGFSPGGAAGLPEGLPVIKREVIFKVLGSAKRWRMLALLMDGEPHRVKELARAGGCSDSLASKDAQVLLKAGLVVERVGLYRLNPVWRAGPGMLDFGHAVLRLDWGRMQG